jgi:hypothetical protein
MANRHPDFEKIKKQFDAFYSQTEQPTPQSDKEYYIWLKALRLDETLPYNQKR